MRLVTSRNFRAVEVDGSEAQINDFSTSKGFQASPKREQTTEYGWGLG